MVFYLPTPSCADEIPVSLEAVVVNPDHIPVEQFGCGVFVAVRHHETQENIIPRLLHNPSESLRVTLCAILPLVVFEKIDAQETESEVYEISHISLHPRLGSILVDINPMQLSVERLVAGDILCLFVASEHRTVFRICSACHPKRVVVDSCLHSFVEDVLVPPHEIVFPCAVVFGDEAVRIYALCSLNPPVGGNHIVAVVLQFSRHPVDIRSPTLFHHRNIMVVAILIGNPVHRPRSLSGELAVPCAESDGRKEQQ